MLCNSIFYASAVLALVEHHLDFICNSLALATSNGLPPGCIVTHHVTPHSVAVSTTVPSGHQRYMLQLCLSSFQIWVIPVNVSDETICYRTTYKHRAYIWSSWASLRPLRRPAGGAPHTPWGAPPQLGRSRLLIALDSDLRLMLYYIIHTSVSSEAEGPPTPALNHAGSVGGPSGLSLHVSHDAFLKCNSDLC